MRDRYRPWLAALLALVIAGLGHAFLRRWGRAFLWFSTILLGALALTFLYGDPNISDPTELPQDVLLPVLLLFLLSALDAYLVAKQQIAEKQQREAATAIAEAHNGGAQNGGQRNGGARAGGPGGSSPGEGGMDAPAGTDGDTGVLSDAMPDEIAGGGPQEGVETVQCPNCGKETDATIDFCHWCTNEFPWAGEDQPNRR